MHETEHPHTSPSLSGAPSAERSERKEHAQPFTSEAFRDCIENEFGLNGATPEERAAQVKTLSPEQVFSLMDTINRRVQGTDESQEYTEHAMKVGEHTTIAPAYRQAVLEGVVLTLQHTPEDVSAARIGDVLALTTVMLHPFHDGNGRTARLLGSVFQNEYDAPDFSDNYALLSQSRDTIRANGGFTLYGYIPHMPDGADQSDPVQVGDYLVGLLTHEPGDQSYPPYAGTFGPAPLYHKDT